MKPTPMTGQAAASEPVVVQRETAQDFPRRLLNIHKLCRWFRKQRGAAAVEFAIVAPVFILLIFSMIEYGRMVMVQQMLTNATREGAREAVLEGATTTAVRTTVQQFLSSGNVTLNTNEIQVLVNGVAAEPGTAEFGDPIQVAITVPFSRVSWLPSPMYLTGGNANLTASSTMRREAIQ